MSLELCYLQLCLIVQRDRNAKLLKKVTLLEISGVLNLQKAEEHPNHATLCGCVLSCTDADKEHDSVNCKQGACHLKTRNGGEVERENTGDIEK